MVDDVLSCPGPYARAKNAVLRDWQRKVCASEVPTRLRDPISHMALQLFHTRASPIVFLICSARWKKKESKHVEAELLSNP